MTQDAEYRDGMSAGRQRPQPGLAVDEAETPMRVQDWSRLQDMQVQITEDGHAVREGQVDMVAADGSVLWLAMDGVLGRQLILKSDGVEAWIHTRSARAHWIVNDHGIKGE